ncbi:reverse transcriptase domain-containing protein [Anabaena subtropica]|uniref:RNA-directed DNA polymerase n=1 Tax=Anabaena subtropica FACHB-260 TaxID=2692884 RepID=A0ABR8CQ78_9NOST|nr:reverse transcriptase domain-containing protein [Anabaena subtropica]MBD2345064.1 RNA-directed DNA polymerase [Anabaena subtropica FACHB-260]
MKKNISLSPLLYDSCEDLSSKFLQLKSPRDVARLLQIPYNYLIYAIYRKDESLRYRTFNIPKKSGDYRVISSPHKSLAIIQRKLSQILYAVYKPRPSIHGFAAKRSIITNAQAHTKKKFILNIDIKDFFDSINFGRVRGLFMAKPYELNEKVATILAQICCFNNKLPQGAPSSPIISNLICSKMDSELQRFAKEYSLFYTRYADDLTLSLTRDELPSELVASYKKGFSQVVIGNEVRSIIEQNGFQINNSKVRLAHRTQRQEVTGLIVNKNVNVNRKYIRNIFGTLHAWEKYGLEESVKTYISKYAKQPILSQKDVPTFLDSLRGKIEFVGSVRGKEDPIYQKLLSIFHGLKNKEIDNAIVVDSEN